MQVRHPYSITGDFNENPNGDGARDEAGEAGSSDRARDHRDLEAPPKLRQRRSSNFGPLSLVVNASVPAGATSAIKVCAAQAQCCPTFCQPSIPASGISRARWRSTFTPPPPLFRCPLRALAKKGAREDAGPPLSPAPVNTNDVTLPGNPPAAEPARNAVLPSPVDGR